MTWPLIAAPFFIVALPYKFRLGLLILGSADWSIFLPPDLGIPPRPPLDNKLAPEESPRSIPEFGD